MKFIPQNKKNRGKQEMNCKKKKKIVIIIIIRHCRQDMPCL